MDHSTMDHSQMDHAAMGHIDAEEGHSAHSGGMTGALGPYSMLREASGTSWQPDTSEHAGLHVMAGNWMFMGHATINGVYDWQSGPRGDPRLRARAREGAR